MLASQKRQTLISFIGQREQKIQTSFGVSTIWDWNLPYLCWVFLSFTQVQLG